MTSLESTTRGEKSQETTEDLNREGLMVLDISDGAEPVARLSGKVVVDARSEPKPGVRGVWTNRKDYDKIGRLYNAVRIAYASGGNREEMNKALLEEAKKLGLSAQEAIVLGEAPEHWKPTTPIAARYVKRPSR